MHVFNTLTMAKILISYKVCVPTAFHLRMVSPNKDLATNMTHETNN